MNITYVFFGPISISSLLEMFRNNHSANETSVESIDCFFRKSISKILIIFPSQDLNWLNIISKFFVIILIIITDVACTGDLTYLACSKAGCLSNLNCFKKERIIIWCYITFDQLKKVNFTKVKSSHQSLLFAFLWVTCFGKLSLHSICSDDLWDHFN